MQRKESRKNSREIVNVFYIGDHFYLSSGTIMSSIYLENGIRTDWGKIQIALREGKDVRIRQATDAELLDAYKQLSYIQSKR